MQQNLVRLTHEQLEDRADEANRDYLAGRTKTQDQLESESNGWFSMVILEKFGERVIFSVVV